MKNEYYKTKESVEEYIRLAKDVNGKELIIKLNEVLSPGSSLLEIGTGPGSDWEILSETHEVTGSDNSTQFLDHLKSKNPNGHFLELDAISLETDQRFHGVYSNKVLHHLKNDELKRSIQRQSEILQVNGIICHSFWKGEDSEVFKGLFVNYHMEENLRSFFGEFFDILLVECYQEFEDGDSLLLIGRKK